MKLALTTQWLGGQMTIDAAGAEWHAVYAPGRWCGFAGECTWLLLDLEMDSPLCAQLWELVSRNAPVDEILGQLTHGGLRTAPHFALVQRDGDAMTAIARGSARVVVDRSSDHPQELLGAGVTTWVERRLAGAAEVELVGDDGVVPVGFAVPLSSGVALAGVIRLATRNAAAVGLPTIAVSIAEMPSVVAGLTAEMPVVESNALIGDDISPAVANRASRPYDHLWEATQWRNVEDAAVWQNMTTSEPTSDPNVAQSVSSDAVPSADVTLSAEDVPSRVEASSIDAEPAGLIESFPWAVASGPGVDAVAEPRVDPTPAPQPLRSWGASVIAGSIDSAEAVEKTVKRSAIKGVAAVPAHGNIAFVGPTVQAVTCVAGHLNPAHAPSCRVCQQALAIQDPVTVPRPVLGILRLSTGDTVTLDRGVVLGRSPRADFDGKGERPHVVRLPSPGQDISRTHLEIKLDGWHVLVTDLDSTNGTMVVVPGEMPRRLRPNDPTMISPGTVVTLADEVTFKYEVGE